MRTLGITVLVLALAASAPAQEKPHTGKYENKEIGLTFSGVYGWDSKFSAGAGAWTELASYREDALDALVVLQIRNNTYGSLAELRSALKTEFKSGGEPAVDRPVYKEIALKDVKMKRGLKLAGIEAEGFAVHVSEEGKKRERFVLVRTYYGKNRLFRVACSSKRSRAKRVRDRFDIAIASLVVTSEDEAAVTGTPFESQRGEYKILVPSGFSMVLPSRGTSDMRFVTGGRTITVSIVSYAYDGQLVDQREDLEEFYGESLKLEENDVKVMGSTGFRGVVTKGDHITLIAGIVKHDRAYRIHTSFRQGKEDEGRRVHEAFLKSFKAGVRR